MATTRSLNRLLIVIAAAVSPFAGGCVADAGEKPSSATPSFSLFGDPARPDISGLWLGSITVVPNSADSRSRATTGVDGRPGTYWAPYPLPYTPAYQKISDDRLAAAKAGRQLGDNSAKCLPFGLPQMLVSKFYPDEILQTPGVVTILMNSTFPIMIWTDGRGHPKDLRPSYNGNSIGYWVGDTLFVDTVGINATTALDSARDPHSGQIHIKWTIERVSNDILHFHITLYDTDAFTEPLTTTNIWSRKSDAKWAILDDASCFENNHELSGKEVPAGFPKLGF